MTTIQGRPPLADLGTPSARHRKVVVPEFGEPDQKDAVHLEHDQAYSVLTHPEMCRATTFPGLTQVLENSSINRDEAWSVSLEGATLSGPALGLPGFVALEILKSDQGLKFYGLGPNQERQEFPASQRSQIACLPGPGRELSLTTYSYQDPGDGKWTSSIRVDSTVTDGLTSQTTLRTFFDRSGQPIKASYRKNFFEPSGEVSVELQKGHSHGTIELYNSRRGSSNRVKVDLSGVQTESYEPRLFRERKEDSPW